MSNAPSKKWKRYQPKTQVPRLSRGNRQMREDVKQLDQRLKGLIEETQQENLSVERALYTTVAKKVMHDLLERVTIEADDAELRTIERIEAARLPPPANDMPRVVQQQQERRPIDWDQEHYDDIYNTVQAGRA